LTSHDVLIEEEHMNVRVAGATALVAALILTGCTQDSDETEEAAEATPAAEAAEEPAQETAEAEPTGEPATIVEVAAGNEDFSTLVAAVEAAGLVETLSGPGPFTVFAPTNEAFEALPEGVLDALLLPENQPTLTKILTFHVLPDEVTSDEITDGEVETVEGQSVTLSTAEGVTVNEATVIIPDVPASNGVIHAIDAVLIPPDVDPATLTG
jgi:uncharacterized surface protein with fasciclin (FAS1) repeats